MYKKETRFHVKQNQASWPAPIPRKLIQINTLNFYNTHFSNLNN